VSGELDGRQSRGSLIRLGAHSCESPLGRIPSSGTAGPSSFAAANKIRRRFCLLRLPVVHSLQATNHPRAGQIRTGLVLVPSTSRFQIRCGWWGGPARDTQRPSPPSTFFRCTALFSHLVSRPLNPSISLWIPIHPQPTSAPSNEIPLTLNILAYLSLEAGFTLQALLQLSFCPLPSDRNALSIS